ncbi:MAG: hypothetical protein V5B34_09635 [Accumulibacter sp.]
MQDLVALVADKNMQFALQGALARPQALGVRSLTYAIRPHMGRDGGVRTTGADVLACDAGRFRHALMMLDFQGCGQEHETPLTLEARLDEQLQRVWGVRAKAIVISPEVDVWLWGADNALHEVLQWQKATPIRDWLHAQGFDFDAQGKPRQPKEAMEAVCREQRLPRSSAIYEKIIGRISLQHCTDPTFQRLRKQLVTWFGH